MRIANDEDFLAAYNERRRDRGYASLTQTWLSLDSPEVVIQPPLGYVRFLEFDRAEEIIAIGHEYAQRQFSERRAGIKLI